MRHQGTEHRPQVTCAPPTVFIDRDGVINRKREDDYVKKWDEFEFLPKAKDGLSLLTSAGCRLIVVTNQRGIARRVMKETDLEEIHRRMILEAGRAGALIAAVYYCPHDIGACTCRKPDVGLFLEAKRDFADVEFSQATLIGDSLSDMEAGRRLGCRNILIGDDRGFPCASSLHDAALTYLARAAACVAPGP